MTSVRPCKAEAIHVSFRTSCRDRRYAVGSACSFWIAFSCGCARKMPWSSCEVHSQAVQLWLSAAPKMDSLADGIKDAVGRVRRWRAPRVSQNSERSVLQPEKDLNALCSEFVGARRT